jgi:uncharacterized membrane protein
MMSTLRKYLIAGLLVWIPLAVTVFIVRVVISLLDRTILLLPENYQPENLWGFTLPGMGLIFAVVILILTGALASNLLGRTLVDVWEKILGRIPLIRNVYNALKQITTTLLARDNKAFRKVVLVQFPDQNMWSMGFLTNPDIRIDSDRFEEDMVAVFISTTPNPTTGFLIIVPSREVIEVDLSIEEAFKMIMSIGVVVPDKDIKGLLIDNNVAQSAPDS